MISKLLFNNKIQFTFFKFLSPILICIHNISQNSEFESLKNCDNFFINFCIIIVVLSCNEQQTFIVDKSIIDSYCLPNFENNFKNTDLDSFLLVVARYNQICDKSFKIINISL